MKKRLIALTMLLSILMVLSSVSSVFAEDGDADGGKTRTPYKYTITVYSGNHGHFTDGSTVKTITVEAGTKVNLGDAEYKVELNKNKEDQQYYVRGFRETGHDNDEEKVVKQAFDADEDASYEVAYGMKGGMVKYTVMYVDAKGKELHASDEYYGMVGDKPIVSYHYIDGYQPNAYNLKKTLVADESKNVFAFSYLAKATGDGDNAGDNAQAGAADANGQNLANANAGANANANANNNGPADVIDLDDNAVPQTDNPGADIGDSDTPKGGINPVAVGGGIVGVGALAGLAAFLIKRRREAEDYE